MASNILFKHYQIDDYIEIAEETAGWLKSVERKTEHGKRWIQSPDSTEDFSDYPMLTEKALYGGSARYRTVLLKIISGNKKRGIFNRSKRSGCGYHCNR